MWSFSLRRMTIKQRIYLMLLGGLLYSVALIALNQYQSWRTSQNLHSIQSNQIRFILIADRIKTKLSKIQNLQVRQIVDTVMEMESSADAIDLLMPEILHDLAELSSYARESHDQELASLSKKLNLRYGMLVANGVELDWELIKRDKEEALMAIEGMIAVADKMNEELTGLIELSHTKLTSGIVEFEQAMEERDRTMIGVGMISMALFTLIGMMFIRSITRRIGMLVEGTRAFAKNRFDYRIPNLQNECHDELCRLAESFNAMAASIENLIEQQQQANALLDQRVREKTKELQQSLQELERTNMIVMDSIHYASKIQHSFLPDRTKMDAMLGEHFVIWNQRDVVGGDFYWMEEVEGGFVVALIDCTGHGVPGSLMTMLAVPLLDRIIKEHRITRPSEVLSSLNKIIKQMLQKGHGELGDDGLDAGICFVNSKENSVTFAGAGIPLFYAKHGEIHEIRPDRKGVGYRDTEIDYLFAEHVVPLDAQTSFYMVTDGITEQVGGQKQRMMFGRKRLRELLKNIHIKAKHEQKNIILETLSAYRGDEPQKDDMTCISFKIAA